MGPSRISRAGLSLLLFCSLVGGGVGVAGLAVGSDRADAAGPTTSTTVVAGGTFDSTPSEDAQTTETATPTSTATESTTPSSTVDADASGAPKDGDSGGGADGSDGTNASDADVESRDPSDFEDTAPGSGADDPDDPGATDDRDGEFQDGVPGVEARSRSRMPGRGPERGTIVVSFDDVAVSTIAFTRRQYGNVTVEVLDGLPPGELAPAGDRLSTLRIRVPDELRDDPAKVMFNVDVATLAAQGIPNDAVWLTHHDSDSGGWDRLETHVVHASEERVVYAANTTGFSLFAIQGDASRVRSPTSTADGSGPGAANVTAADEAEAASVGAFGLPVGVVLFMGAVSVATTVFGARRVSGVEAGKEN